MNQLTKIEIGEVRNSMADEKHDLLDKYFLSVHRPGYVRHSQHASKLCAPHVHRAAYLVKNCLKIILCSHEVSGPAKP